MNRKNIVLLLYLSGCHHCEVENHYWRSVLCFQAKDLSAESLLNLSVRKASDWFKNELRKEGGLDHFCRATILAMEYFNNELESQDLTEFMLERLRRIEQYMRLLENVSVILGLKYFFNFWLSFFLTLSRWLTWTAWIKNISFSLKSDHFLIASLHVCVSASTTCAVI